MSMSKTTNSIPKGVTIDIDASPEDKSTSKSLAIAARAIVPVQMEPHQKFFFVIHLHQLKLM